MANKQIKASELKGLNIYQDPKKGTLIYDIFTGNAYHLTTQDIKGFTLSKAILPIAVLVFYLLDSLKIKTSISIIVAVVAYIAGQLVYRFNFLYKLPCEEKYQRPDNGNIIERFSGQYSKGILLALLVLCALLVITIIFYIISEHLSGAYMIVFILMAIVAALMASVALLALLKK